MTADPGHGCSGGAAEGSGQACYLGGYEAASSGQIGGVMARDMPPRWRLAGSPADPGLGISPQSALRRPGRFSAVGCHPGSAIVLIDDRTRRDNLAAAFGTAIQHAVAFATGRPATQEVRLVLQLDEGRRLGVAEAWR